MSDGFLTKQCDACGSKEGGWKYHCPKCNITLCFGCGLKLILNSHQYPLKCPMCGGEFI